MRSITFLLFLVIIVICNAQFSEEEDEFADRQAILKLLKSIKVETSKCL